jgi:hypothetical protein
MRTIFFRVFTACTIVVVCLLGTRPEGGHPVGVAAARADQTLTFNPEADSYVDQSNPDSNFGTRTSLRLKAPLSLYSFLRFNVQGVAGSITHATLSLYANSSQSSGYQVHAVADNSWGETTLTYNNAPAFDGAVIASSGPVTAGTWSTVDVTPLITGDGQVSVALTTQGVTQMNLGSRESATPPVLEVDTVTAGDPVLYAAGDISCDPANSHYNGGYGSVNDCHMKATSDTIANADPPPAAILTLGDNQYETNSIDQYGDLPYPSGSWNNGINWGRFCNQLSCLPNFHPAIGNHEYSTPGASGYFTNFRDAATPLDPGCIQSCRGYYSFDVGTWHVIALNAECSQIGGCGHNSPEERWLQTDLAADTAVCTLAYWHEPLFSSGGRAATKGLTFWNDLYNAGASVVLTGHDHIYERFAPQGIAIDLNNAPYDPNGMREFVVGTGGNNHTSLQTQAPNSEVANTNTFGVLELTLHPTSYDWQFIPDGSGSFTDSGTGQCR